MNDEYNYSIQKKGLKSCIILENSRCNKSYTFFDWKREYKKTETGLYEYISQGDISDNSKFENSKMIPQFYIKNVENKKENINLLSKCEDKEKNIIDVIKEIKQNINIGINIFIEQRVIKDKDNNIMIDICEREDFYANFYFRQTNLIYTEISLLTLKKLLDRYREDFRVVNKDYENIICFSACATKKLLELWCHSILYEKINKRESKLYNKLNRKVMNENISIYDVAQHGNCDDEGTENKKIHIVNNGKLCTFLTSAAHEKKYGIESVGRTVIELESVSIKLQALQISNCEQKDYEFNVITCIDIFQVLSFNTRTGVVKIVVREAYLVNKNSIEGRYNDRIISFNLFNIFNGNANLGNLYPFQEINDAYNCLFMFKDQIIFGQ